MHLQLKGNINCKIRFMIDKTLLLVFINQMLPDLVSTSSSLTDKVYSWLPAHKPSPLLRMPAATSIHGAFPFICLSVGTISFFSLSKLPPHQPTPGVLPTASPIYSCITRVTPSLFWYHTHISLLH